MIATESRGDFGQLPATKSRDCEELRGHKTIVVRFSEKVSTTSKRSGGEWVFAIPALGVSERAASREEAERNAADKLAAEVNKLTRAFSDDLSGEERERRAKLLRYVDLLGGEIGLDFPKDRWLLGRIRENLFVPVQDDFEPITVPADPGRVSGPEKLWLARVAVFRDGRPTGEVLELKPAPDDSSAAEVP